MNVFARFCMNRSTYAVCAKMIPKLLTPEQNKSRMNICANILKNIDTDPGLLDTVLIFFWRNFMDTIEKLNFKNISLSNFSVANSISYEERCTEWRFRPKRVNNSKDFSITINGPSTRKRNDMRQMVLTEATKNGSLVESDKSKGSSASVVSTKNTPLLLTALDVVPTLPSSGGALSGLMGSGRVR
ncbi:hypothetical protein NQ318_004070 [Aromia moschata]|uniref:Uncharacterized protein n=1 Tax=Aromia moschata TaxID=1265417 RepID=A0AAV8ZAI0_9CUCU|nr:hypothetical protein NQ318_004070 [Aromia moschata]